MLHKGDEGENTLDSKKERRVYVRAYVGGQGQNVMSLLIDKKKFVFFLKF